MKKKTGEWDLFIEIWKERPHRCIQCNIDLGNKPLPIFFSHILTKGRTPELRLDKRNIELLCAVHHIQWETGDLDTKRKFKWTEEKKELVKEYNYLLYCKLFGDD